MCGRFTLTKDTTEIAQRWQIRRIEVEVKPRYNIAPTQNVLIVTDDGEREPPTRNSDSAALNGKGRDPCALFSVWNHL